MFLHIPVTFGITILHPILGVKSTKQPSLGVIGGNAYSHLFWCHLQAWRTKYLNLHIIETTARIVTEVCKVIKTTKYPLWMVQTRISKMSDSRHLEYS